MDAAHLQKSTQGILLLLSMWVYNLVVFLYGAMIRLGAPFHKKANLWVQGRRNIFSRINKTLREKRIDQFSKKIWFHCASLGEFEQGRPVIEKLKKDHPEVKVILTFFSPSGYEIRKDYASADAVFYLPLDLPGNVNKFLDLVKPDAAVFVKYEFWLNYLAQLRERNIPTYLVSAVFRSDQHFFKWYGKSFFTTLGYYRRIFVQDENSLKLLTEKRFKNVELAGDTRFDRVMEITRDKSPIGTIERFCGTSPVLIAGSTWPKDDELVIGSYAKLKQKNPALKLLLVPHEIGENSISAIEKKILHANSSLFFARFSNNQDFSKHDILIIDTIGMLSRLYRYAQAAYVGGGFADGIHNILEVLAHGIPVSFGPNHEKFVEALETRELGIGRPIQNEAELLAFFSEMITDEGKLRQLRAKINTYMQSKTGATEKILQEIPV
jgi:3-deoxy-D-manno-octulosonic-acid transferase